MVRIANGNAFMQAFPSETRTKIKKPAKSSTAFVPTCTTSVKLTLSSRKSNPHQTSQKALLFFFPLNKKPLQAPIIPPNTCPNRETLSSKAMPKKTSLPI